MRIRKDSNTYHNLMSAYAAESRVTNKYHYYYEKAKKEGLEEIAQIFKTTSDNERAHAKVWFDLLYKVGNTRENLQDGIDGENWEWTDMYRAFAEQAREEGYDQIADLFDKVGTIESEHEERYQNCLDQLESGTAFFSKVNDVWICRNCGHRHTGKEPPEHCPVCHYKMGYFEKLQQ